MRHTIYTQILFAFALSWVAVEAKHSGHQLRRHDHHRLGSSLHKKRGDQCSFPTDVGLVSVTPTDENSGWAMSPNQPCEPGNYCPYACPPGKVAMQWNPQATSYVYPLSMDGGLYCNDNGEMEKPFPDRDYCVEGTGNFIAKNHCNGTVAFCQTVLPGNEAMLIPTAVDDEATLAVPGIDYWAETAAHFYINPPGTSTDDACVWGSSSEPVGNWSPYVAGANTDGNGLTYVKLGWNPIYLEDTTPFRDVMPTWGAEIRCDGDGCNGLPCAIDPSENGVNEMVGDSSVGAGGATFCVATIPSGQSAHIHVFENSRDSIDGSSSSSTVAATSTSVAASSSTGYLSSSTESSSAVSTTESASSSCVTSTSEATADSSSLVSSSAASATSAAVKAAVKAAAVSSSSGSPLAENATSTYFQPSNSQVTTMVSLLPTASTNSSSSWNSSSNVYVEATASLSSYASASSGSTLNLNTGAQMKAHAKTTSSGDRLKVHPASFAILAGWLIMGVLGEI